MVDNYTWENEEFFPLNSFQCPPSAAQNFVGDIFRFLISETPSEKDFCLFSSSKNFQEKNKNNPEILCQGSGYSIYLGLNEITADYKKKIKNSKGFKKKFKAIGKIQIDGNDGVVLPTPSKSNKQHHTFWSARNKEYVSRVEVVSTY